MPNGDLKCSEHSGCVERISGLEKENITQWTGIKNNRDRIDAILARVNIILGGMVTACILLVINIILNYKK